jgi:hypothetical protein
MNTFVIYTPFVTERLQYVLDFICSTRNVHWQITNDRQQFIQQDSAAKFNYSNETFSKCFPQINPAPVLLEDGVKPYQIEKVRFGNDECMSFDGHVDPLASIFYVLSRYEEYLTQAKDEHDRFIAQHSLQKKFDWLQLPIADVWALEFLNFLQVNHPYFEYQEAKSKLILSFDIDNTFAFKHKNAMQLIGGQVKDFFKGNSANIDLRREVLEGQTPDPNDTFEQIKSYQKRGCDVKLFWHLGDFKQYDRNISWTNVVHQRLIQQLSSNMDIGSHPSYESYLNERLVRQERGRLEHITKKPVYNSRQHFLKLNIPGSYRLLNNLGYKHDYSMGFADEIGFRMGTAQAVPFYDLLADETLPLLIHPFVYMDGTLNQYMKLSIEAAKIEVAKLAQQVKKYGGDFICIWHNDTINNRNECEGWTAVLEHTISQFENESNGV